MKTLTKMICTAAIVSLLWGCNNNSDSSNSTNSTSPSANTANTASPQASAGATKIKVTEKDMVVLLSANSAPAGKIDFVTTNVGPSAHELLVIKSDLPANKLPAKNGVLDEKAKGITVIDEIEEDDLKKGSTKTLSVNLTPGKYYLVCNYRRHFGAGMFTPFTVQ